MNKNSELIRNTVIIFIGRFCTQFISFFLVPLHTTYLLTSDYGYIDLIQNYIFLVLPIVFLRLDSAIFRFLVESRKNEFRKKEVITSSVFLMLLLNLCMIIVALLASNLYTVNYFFPALLSIITISLSNFFLQLVRGIGKNNDYAIASVISGLVTLFFNYFLIVILNQNASAILYATAIANFICIIYIIFRIKIYNFINFKYFKRDVLKEMLNYSLPMIADGLSWWVVNVSDRILISTFLGVAFNGVYAISGKLSNILSSLYQIFNMSWQESASLHIDTPDSENFFTEVLNNSYRIFYSICHFILVILPFVFYWIVGSNFDSAYNYIPPLLLANLFNALANIIGAVYIAKKETRMVSKTTLIAAMTNVIINIMFLKKFGLYIATISTLLSYILLTAIRYFDVKKYIKMELEPVFFTQSLLVFIVSCIIYFLRIFYLNVINFFISVIYLVFINRKLVLKIFKKGE